MQRKSEESFNNFNEACYSGDIKALINCVTDISSEERETGFKLACSNNNIIIVKYLIENKLVNDTFQNCYSVLQNAFISSFPNGDKVRKYILKEKEYIPNKDDHYWLQENGLDLKEE